MSTEGGALAPPSHEFRASRLVGMRRILGVAVAALLATTAACAAELPDFTAASTSDPSGTESAAGSATIPASTTTTEPPLFVPEQLTDLEILPITIVDGDTIWVLTVAVADSDGARRQGLMNVADLGDLDGMLFVWEEASSSSFWMQDVILPLDIAFFGEDLLLVDSFTMPLCTTDECPSFLATGPFRYAVETLESTFSGMSPAAMLVLDP